MALDAPIGWRYSYRWQGPRSDLCRGEAADFLPHFPTPLTASGYTAAQPHLTRALRAWLNVDVAPLWVVADGVLFLNGRGWRAFSDAMDVPYGLVAHILGLPEADTQTEPAGRRLWGLLPPASPHKRWLPHYHEAQERLDRVQRWVRRTLAYAWSQAEVLQVMEEIAVRIAEVLAVHAVATVALAGVLYRAPQATPEVVYRHLPWDRMPTLQPVVAAQGAADRAWSGQAQLWTSPAPFEVAAFSSAAAPASSFQPVLRSDGENEGDSLWEAVASWVRLREATRAALAWVIAVTRVWTQAAAREGMADGRLRQPEDACFLEIEELKQLLTGEWSDPGPVHHLVERRRRGWPPSDGPIPPGEAISWLAEVPERVVSGEIVGAPGWHPGLALQTSASEGIAALSDGLFAYGRLVAAVKDLSFYSAASNWG